MAKVAKTEKIDGATRYHIKHGIHKVTYDIATTFTPKEIEDTLMSYMLSLEQKTEENTLTKTEVNEKFAKMKGEKPSLLSRLLRRNKNARTNDL